MTGIGLCVPQLGPHVTPAAVRTFAERAEAIGFTSLWVQDHFMYVALPENGYGNFPGASPPPQYETVWQPLELLSALAMCTATAILGTSVLVAGTHWPVQLAARLATLDQLSGGRLVVGLGAG
ncbi:MAG: LLM class flavin-dependent oxidoreductase, partial [Ilumatobacteraceae bacterium]